MTVTISGTSGITTPGLTSSAASSFSADVTLAGSGVDVLNNSGNKVLGQTGSVVQVVSYSASLSFSTTSTSYVAVGLSASITPTSSTSKILVIASGAIYTDVAGIVAYATIYRNGANLTGANGMATIYADTSRTWDSACLTTYDSPASTSSQTYAVYIKASSNTVNFGDGGTSQQTITLLEIAA